MGASNAAYNAELDAFVGASGESGYLSLHSADPGTTGANEISGSTRVALTWSAAASATKAASAVSVAVPAGNTATYVGYWNASTSGTFRFSQQLSAPIGAGTASVTPSVSATGPS